MPEQRELAARVSTYMAQLANLSPKSADEVMLDVQCPECDRRFQVELPKRDKRLRLVKAS